MQRRLFVFACILGMTLFLVTALAGFASTGLAAPGTASTGPVATLPFSTFLGAPGTEEGFAIEVDDQGRVYVAGFTASTTFPTRTTASQQHGIDTFWSRLAPDGGSADFTEWVNAASLFAPDNAYDLAVDKQGAMVVTGDASSSDFCSYFGAGIPGYDTSYNGNADAFVLKVKADGSGLEYCTFLGGNDVDVGRAISLAADGSVWVSGSTWSTDFPTTTLAADPTHNGLRDSFLARLSADGTQLLYSSYLGGSGQEETRSMALDSDGGPALTGWTFSTDFPVTAQAAYTTAGGGADAFLAQFDADGLIQGASYLGGEDEDRGMALTFLPDGTLAVAGLTASANFPLTLDAIDSQLKGLHDAFLVRISPELEHIRFSTLLGGAGDDRALGMAADSIGTLVLTGQTTSSDWPRTPDAGDSNLDGPSDAFLLRLHAGGVGSLPGMARILYSSYLGGSLEDRGSAIAIAGEDTIVLTGGTRSTDFPTTAGALDESHNGEHDVFITAVKLPPPVPKYQTWLPYMR